MFCLKYFTIRYKYLGLGLWLGLWCLTTFSTIFQLYRGCQFLLVDETGVHGENHRPTASHRQTLSHKVESSTPRHGLSYLAIIIIPLASTSLSGWN